MSISIKKLINDLISEEIATISGNFVWGKDRNGGNVKPSQRIRGDGTEPAEDVYIHKLQQLEPQIKLSSLYREFLKDIEMTNPEDDTSLFAIYHNFLRTFGIDKEQFQNGQPTDRAAAHTVYEFFNQYIIDDDVNVHLFKAYGK